MAAWFSRRSGHYKSAHLLRSEEEELITISQRSKKLTILKRSNKQLTLLLPGGPLVLLNLYGGLFLPTSTKLKKNKIKTKVKEVIALIFLQFG